MCVYVCVLILSGCNYFHPSLRRENALTQQCALSTQCYAFIWNKIEMKINNGGAGVQICLALQRLTGDNFKTLSLLTLCVIVKMLQKDSRRSSLSANVFPVSFVPTAVV